MIKKLNLIAIFVLLSNPNQIFSMDEVLLDKQGQDQVETKLSFEGCLNEKSGVIVDFPKSSSSTSLNMQSDDSEDQEKPSRCQRITGAIASTGSACKKGFLNLLELPSLLKSFKKLPKTVCDLPKNISANKKNLAALGVSCGIAIGASYIFPDDTMLRYAAQANFGKDFHNFIKKMSILAKLSIAYGLSYATGNLDEVLQDRIGFSTNIWYSFWLACVFTVLYKANQSRTPDKKIVETEKDVEKAVENFVNKNPKIAAKIQEQVLEVLKKQGLIEDSPKAVADKGSPA